MKTLLKHIALLTMIGATLMAELVCADTFSKTFSAGWHLISAPCAVEGIDPGVLFAPLTSDISGLDAGCLANK